MDSKFPFLSIWKADIIKVVIRKGRFGHPIIKFSSNMAKFPNWLELFQSTFYAKKTSFASFLVFEVWSILHFLIPHLAENLTISRKLRILKKKSYMQKNERQINSNLPCKFGHLFRKSKFWAPKTPLSETHSAQIR